MIFVCVCSVISNSVTPWTIDHQASLVIEFSKQEYWSGLPFPVQEIFLTWGSNLHLLCLLHWQVNSLPLAHLGSPIMSLTIPKNYIRSSSYANTQKPPPPKKKQHICLVIYILVFFLRQLIFFVSL